MTRAAPALPDWPALMDRAMAADYLRVSQGSFTVIAAKQNLRPVQMDVDVIRWRRRDLDALIDSLPLRGVPSDPEAAAAALAVIPGAAGLEKARRRLAGR